MSEGTFVTLHSQWDSEHPKDLAYARQLDESRQAKGLPPAREYPCSGALRVHDETPAGRLLVCDVCDWQIVERQDAERTVAF